MSSSADSDDAELRVICGPTAAGKSALALALAERAGALLLSADSRQVYRGFDVGTAKATAAEQARVPHRGIDLVEPTVRYSAARWAADAEGWLAEAEQLRRPALVVGGTGFYVRALVDPLFRSPDLDGDRRARLEAALALRATDELRRWTEALDPARAHLGRAQLLRAVETALLTGHRISDLHAVAVRSGRSARYLVVDPGRDALLTRIEERIDEMLAAGWLDEVRALADVVPGDAPAWNATGYRSMRAHVRGDRTLAAARRETIVATRQYAKRQRTWIRHQLPEALVTRLDPRSPDALQRALEWWSGASSPHEVPGRSGHRHLEPGRAPGGESRS